MDNNYYMLILEWNDCEDADITFLYGDSPSKIVLEIKEECYGFLEDEDIAEDLEDECPEEMDGLYKLFDDGKKGKVTLKQLEDYLFDVGGSGAYTLAVGQGKEGLIKIFSYLIDEANDFGKRLLKYMRNEIYCRETLERILSGEEYIQELEGMQFRIRER